MTYLKPIYRDYSCTLSQKNCTALLQALALCKATITCNFSLGAYHPNNLNRCTMFFRLKFSFQEDLDKFHEMGFTTTDLPKISVPLQPEDRQQKFQQAFQESMDENEEVYKRLAGL